MVDSYTETYCIVYVKGLVPFNKFSLYTDLILIFFISIKLILKRKYCAIEMSGNNVEINYSNFWFHL